MCRGCDIDCGIDEYLKNCASVKSVDDLVIMCDEIKDKPETVYQTAYQTPYGIP